jgi:hypothetical protein
MPSTYNLAFGGQRTANPGLAMLPQVAPLPDDVFETASHKGPVVYSPTRWLAFPGSAISDACFSCGGAECSDSRAIRDFVCGTPLLQGDAIYTHVIPRFSTVERIWWSVVNAVAGAQFTLSFMDTTGSGPVSIPITGGVLDGAVVDSGIINLAAPLYFKENGFLRLTFTALPAAPATPSCQGCEEGGQTAGIALLLSPIIWEYARGAF